jgi:hypothetical protein
LEQLIGFSGVVCTRALAKLPAHGCTVVVLTSLMTAILQVPGRWFYYSKSNVVKRRVVHLTKDTCKDFAAFWLLFAAKLLETIGAGKVLMTVHIPGVAGSYSWFFAKCDVPADSELAEVLSHLGVSTDTTPTLAAYNASAEAEKDAPPRAPSNWNAEPAPSIVERVALMHALGLVVPAEAAPGEGQEEGHGEGQGEGQDAALVAAQEAPDEALWDGDKGLQAEAEIADLEDLQQHLDAGFGA